MITTKGSRNLDNEAKAFLDMEDALQNLLDQAYDEGHEAGYNEGYDNGQKQNE